MKYIELAGQSYPVAFGYGALMEYEAITGKNAVELVTGGNTSVTDTITLIACALTNGAEEAGQPQDFTAKSAARLIDATPNSPAVVIQVMEMLGQSFAVEEAKKKTVPLHANRETRRKAKTG